MDHEAAVVLDIELLEARIVARMLSLRVSTVYAAAKAGRLPHVVLWAGRKRPLIRFRRADIEAFVLARVSKVVERARS
jgi:predicted DNA-binding transcriptional regulator AlpA